MMPYTLDNHFSFGYGEGLFNPNDRTDENRLWCAYSRCTQEPGLFPEECVETAKLIGRRAQELGRPIFVCLSGGMDSEVVAKSFLSAGVPFTAITFRFLGGLNSHEIRFVNSFVASHKIKHMFYDIDILSWIASQEAEELFHGAQTASLNLLPHMKLMNHIWFELGGLPVLGNGDVYFENHDSGWKYVELEYMLSWFKHAIRMKILGGIGFFQFTPEITLSMLREPKLYKLGMNYDSYANRIYKTSKHIKYAIYRKYWPDLTLRPKFGGQEMVEKQYEARTATLLDGKNKPAVDKFVLHYQEFRAMLEPVGSAYLQGEGAQFVRTAMQTKLEN
jgi:hypothetical protein